MIRCAMCADKFDSKDIKWVEILPGNEQAVCPTCFSDSAKVAKYKKATVKKVHPDTMKAYKSKEVAKPAKKKASKKKS